MPWLPSAFTRRVWISVFSVGLLAVTALAQEPRRPSDPTAPPQQAWPNSSADPKIQGISVLGEVKHPGVYSAWNARRLSVLFQIAGGFTPCAGKTVTITHAKDPANPVVLTLQEGGTTSSQGDAEIQPGDTVVVARAGVVYVVGEVNRPGMFVMETAQTASLLQVLALAAGPTQVAALGHTRLIRRTANGLESKDIDLKKILRAKGDDIDLQAEDIVFVPSSRGKRAADRGVGSVLDMLTNLALYRF